MDEDQRKQTLLCSKYSSSDRRNTRGFAPCHLNVGGYAHSLAAVQRKTTCRTREKRPRHLNILIDDSLCLVVRIMPPAVLQLQTLSSYGSFNSTSTFYLVLLAHIFTSHLFFLMQVHLSLNFLENVLSFAAGRDVDSSHMT